MLVQSLVVTVESFCQMAVVDSGTNIFVVERLSDDTGDGFEMVGEVVSFAEGVREVVDRFVVGDDSFAGSETGDEEVIAVGETEIASAVVKLAVLVTGVDGTVTGATEADTDIGVMLPVVVIETRLIEVGSGSATEWTARTPIPTEGFGAVVIEVGEFLGAIDVLAGFNASPEVAFPVVLELAGERVNSKALSMGSIDGKDGPSFEGNDIAVDTTRGEVGEIGRKTGFVVVDCIAATWAKDRGRSVTEVGVTFDVFKNVDAGSGALRFVVDTVGKRVNRFNVVRVRHELVNSRGEDFPVDIQ